MPSTLVHAAAPSPLHRRAVMAGLIVFAWLFTTTAATAAGGEHGKANASQLAASADRAVGQLVKVARASSDPKLKPSASAGKPFWAALRRLNQAVDKLGRGLYLQDKTFFYGLGDAVSAVTAASVALTQSGATDARVRQALGRVEQAVTLLDNRFGKVAARRAKGGGLSKTEERQLAAMRSKQKELQRRLQAVEGKASGNRRAIDGIEQIRRQSDRIYYARNTLGDFLAALIAIRVVDGLLWGWYPWWGPWGGWVESYSVGYLDGYYDAIDVIDYDWAVVETEVALDDYELDVAGDAAGDDADLAEADAWLDDSSLDMSAADSAALASDAGWADEGLSDQLEDRLGDEAGLGGDAMIDSTESLPAAAELELPERFDPVDAAPEAQALDSMPSGFDAEGAIGAGAGIDSGFGGGYDRGGYDGGGFDAGGYDGGGFDGGMDMDMGGGDIDF